MCPASVGSKVSVTVEVRVQSLEPLQVSQIIVIISQPTLRKEGAILLRRDKMVNMKLILLVSLAVVFVEAVPVREHTLVKRGIFDNFMESARNHLDTAAAAVQQHVQTASEHLQRTREQLATQLQTHHENAREHLSNIREQMGGHFDNVRDHFRDLADDLGLDSNSDTEEDESEPVVDLS